MTESVITPERLAEVVRAIPRGRWMSYADVARASGGTERHARSLNQRFIRAQLSGAHRVLTDRGAVATNALRDSLAVRARLEAEGVVFVGDRADPRARVRPRDLADAAASHGQPDADRNT